MIYSTLHTRQMKVVPVGTLASELKLLAEGVAEVSGEEVTHVLQLEHTGTIVAYCSTYSHAEAYRQSLEAMNNAFEADTSLEAKPIVTRSFWAKAKAWASQFIA